MRSQSPLLSPQNYKQTTNIFTPTQKRHVSQLSTGKNISNTSQTDIKLKKKEFQLLLPSQVLEKPKLFQTANNYYRTNSITKVKPSESPTRILFKTGFEQQEEIKRLKIENQNLKEIMKKQQDQLKQFSELGNILELNKQLQEKIEKLEKENSILRQNVEENNKNE
ncbi:unnamed protein product [Paramecium sonneborni]|uniref:Uncharacterized protein n=1 Tax=Paramecium sonneborni TaxID=65129 RepID=A0A8S1LC81_9CILI|nr:unnamed protein product [Paramecium sonneborni]